MTNAGPDDYTVGEEILDVSREQPHVVLLGAGASFAAVPADRSGKPVPLLRDVARDLSLEGYFPPELRPLARSNFEAAYSKLVEIDGSSASEVENEVRTYFASLELPDAPTVYDFILLSLRPKDAIFTFNWDPFLLQAYQRLNSFGLEALPRVHFLHGNVKVGYCDMCHRAGAIEDACNKCGVARRSSPLLFPVEQKDYQTDPFIFGEWENVRLALGAALMFTIFGYSAPVTDVEAVRLLKEGWGDVDERRMEQTEIIQRPGADQEALRQRWDSFIHTHHYDVFGSFFESWMAHHPRRSIEAFYQQTFYAKFVADNPVPSHASTLAELVDWFRPLLDAEA